MAHIFSKTKEEKSISKPALLALTFVVVMFRKGFRSRSDRLSSLIFAVVVGVGSGVVIFKQNQAREASIQRRSEKALK